MFIVVLFMADWCACCLISCFNFRMILSLLDYVSSTWLFNRDTSYSNCCLRRVTSSS